MAVSWSSAIRISLLVLLVVASAAAFFTLPVEKILKEFLVWINQNLGLWGGPVVLQGEQLRLLLEINRVVSEAMHDNVGIAALIEDNCRAVAYIPLTILAVPAAVLSLGGGYLFGLPIGFLADSVGATIGSVAAFLLGRALGRPYVISKMNDYPDIQAVAIAIEKSGFKIVLLLRLAPLVPFCLLNYFLSVTPIGLAEYTMASWLGMMPITLALVYVGTTLKELAEVTHGWSELSIARWATMIAGLLISAVLMVCVTREAKAALQRALAENSEAGNILTAPSTPPSLPSLLQPCSDLNQPLMIMIDSSNVDVEN